jgi:chromosome segregation ATPase
VVIGWLLHALAQSEQRTESRTGERFDTLGRHVQERFDAQERRMDRIEQRIDRIEQRIDALDDRIRSVEEHMHSIDKQLARIGGLLDGLREAIVQRATRE